MHICVTITALTTAAALTASGAQAKPELLSPDAEIVLALSAAPKHLQAEAGIHLLNKDGFRRHRDSKSGFECLVERDGDTGIAPICFDKEGAETTLKAVLKEARLVQSGMAPEEVKSKIAAAYASGELLAPRRPGVAYMLSLDFKDFDKKQGKMVCVYPPHTMFYAPYLKNADLGIPKSDMGSQARPWILHEGEPRAYIIVADHSAQHKCE